MWWQLSLTVLLLCDLWLFASPTSTFLTSDRHLSNAFPLTREPTIAPTRVSGHLPTVEYNALYSLYNATKGQAWRCNDTVILPYQGKPWTFTTPPQDPCQFSWQGVGCTCPTGSQCTVSKLILVLCNLTGTIPSEIGDLHNLTELSFSRNNMYGSIPSTIGNLHQLQIFNLKNNRFTGSLPLTFGNMSSLVFANLTTNAFHGSLPPSFYHLHNLEVLDLSFNSFKGTLSDAIGNMTALQELHAVQNNFKGSIPAAMCNLPRLTKLLLRVNEFSSVIPEGFIRKNFTILDLGHNKLVGTIPPFGLFPNMTRKLRIFHVDSNYLTGTLPREIGNLTSLGSFYVYNNLLDGTIPLEYGYLPNIGAFNIQGNMLTGTIPSTFALMPTVRVLAMSTNFLEGRCDVLYQNKRNLITVITFGNMFTGTLPSQSSFPLITVFMAGRNFLTGSIPVNFADSKLMIICSVSNNILTGTIPAFFSDMFFVSYLNFGGNIFTGTIPEDIFYSRNLAEYIVSNNQLTGTIPASVGNTKQLLQLTLNNNRLHGTVPAGLWNSTTLVSLSLSSNYLHGQLPERIAMASYSSLTNIDFSENSFSGSFPSTLMQLPSLQNLLASSNCFDGSLTEDICRSQTLQNLVMDGLSTANSCQRRLFPGIPGFTAFNAKKPMMGTIPLCLFESPQLQSVYLSGNNFEGSFPENINISKSLIKLSLAHNLLTGTIPLAIQEHDWFSLDLSYNRFHGTLASSISPLPINGSLNLEVNRLSGTIPDSLLSTGTISMLEGNIFSCDGQRDRLPKNDPEYVTYTCASDIIDYTVYSWLCILFTFTVGSIIVGLQIMYINHKEYSFYSLWILAIQFYHILHSKITEQLDDTSYHRETGVYPLQILHRLLSSIRFLFLAFTAFIIFFLLPIYTTVSNTYGAYDYSYAWQISCILVSGEVAGAVFCLLFSLTIVVFFYLYFNKIVSLHLSLKDQLYQSGIAKVKRSVTFLDAITALMIGIANFAVMVLIDVAYVIAVLNEDGTTILVIQVMLSAFKLGWNEIALWRAYPMLKRFILKRLRIEQAAEIDAFIAAYDDIDDEEHEEIASAEVHEMKDMKGLPPPIPTLASTPVSPKQQRRKVSADSPLTNGRKRLASSDSGGNSPSVVSGRKRFQSTDAVPSSRKPLAGAVDTDSPGESADRKRLHTIDGKVHSAVSSDHSVVTDSTTAPNPERESIMSEHDLGYTFSRFEVSFFVLTVIMNNIIIPCIAIAVISTDCYHNAFFSNPPSEQTTVSNCAITANLGPIERCLDNRYVVTTETTTYNTPFVYRYQCSAAFVMNFAAVHIFMFVFVGILVPVGKLVLKFIYDSAKRDSKMYKIVRRILPRYLKDLQSVPPKRRMIIIDKDRMIVKLSAYLSIVLTFGVLFPPLSIIACLSVYVMTYFEEYWIARILSYAKKARYSWYRPHLERECDRVAQAWYGILWLLMPFASFSYFYIVLDTVGETDGWQTAMIPGLFLLVLPWFILVWRRLANKYHLPMLFPNRYAKNKEDRTLSDNRYIRSISMAVTTAVKPLAFTQKDIDEGRQSDIEIVNELHSIQNGYRPTDVWKYFDPSRQIAAAPSRPQSIRPVASAPISNTATGANANSSTQSSTPPSNGLQATDDRNINEGPLEHIDVDIEDFYPNNSIVL